MKLFIVPTPIGNLEDITLRAISTLKSVDLILAEDTRTSGKLLKHFEISTPMQSYHMHNEHKILDRIIEKLKSGFDIKSKKEGYNLILNVFSIVMIFIFFKSF